jgi:hypothetical protein
VIKLLLVPGLLLAIAAPSLSQSGIIGLPKGAVILETRKVPPAIHPNRTLVLWMISPKKNPTNYKPADIYTCPDQTRGSYYSGPTRVSLVDSATNRVINTVNLTKDDEDNFDLPYAIRRGYYYRVDTIVGKGAEAKPTIMALKDYNGDGKALEFALFDAQACMGLDTTLIGYSVKQDRVVQYPLQLAVIEGSKHSERTSPWADYLFSKKPLRPGYWKYEIDYRGRAGTLDKWEIRYNPNKEQFEGKLTVAPGEP